MFYYVQVLLSYTILPALVILLLKFKALTEGHKWLLLLLSIGLLNEILSALMIYWFRTNLILVNIYALLESFLIVKIFFEWGAFNSVRSYRAIIAGIPFFWILDNLIIHNIHQVNGGFQVLYSLLISFLAIKMLNKQLVLEKLNVRGISFLVSIGYLMYFSSKACTEVFYLLPFRFNDAFYNGLIIILVLFNLLLNSIYIIAALCIPQKNKYILLSQ